MLQKGDCDIRLPVNASSIKWWQYWKMLPCFNLWGNCFSGCMVFMGLLHLCCFVVWWIGLQFPVLFTSVYRSLYHIIARYDYVTLPPLPGWYCQMFNVNRAACSGAKCPARNAMPSGPQSNQKLFNKWKIHCLIPLMQTFPAIYVNTILWLNF